MKIRYLVSSCHHNNYTFNNINGVTTFLKTLSGQEVEDEVRIFRVTSDSITQLEFNVKYNDEFEVEIK